MSCGVLGIFGIAGTYNLLYIYAMELFPTVVRNAALGCARQVGQFGNILVPFVVVMDARYSFMVFGFCGIVGGILVFYLPETLNKPLYDTIDTTVDKEDESLCMRKGWWNGDDTKKIQYKFLEVYWLC